MTRLQVISSSQFKLFLELEPQLREVLQCFYDSRSHTTPGLGLSSAPDAL